MILNRIIMKRSIHLALAVFLIIGGLSNKFTSGATVAEVIEQVSTESYTNYLQNELYTHDGDERCFGPQHDLAQQRIRELFESIEASPVPTRSSSSGPTMTL
jgi:hypothetical protein